MSPLASGQLWKPHLKLDGKWVVKWRASLNLGTKETLGILCASPEFTYIEVFDTSMHFMTQSTPRGHKARRWCEVANAKLGRGYFPHPGDRS